MLSAALKDIPVHAQVLISKTLNNTKPKMSSGSYRGTEEPQRVDSTRADAEWKADPGLGNLTNGADGKVSSSDFRISYHAVVNSFLELGGRSLSQSSLVPRWRF